MWGFLVADKDEDNGDYYSFYNFSLDFVVCTRAGHCTALDIM